MNRKFFLLAILSLTFALFSEKSHAQASGVKPELIMYRHNGGGISPAPVNAGDILGTLKWNGLVSIGNIATGASIRAKAQIIIPPAGGNPASIRTDMIFSTSSNDRMIINQDGLVGIGTLLPIYHLDVVGNTHTSGRFFGRIHFDANEPTDLPSSYIDEAYFERKSRAQLGLGANTYANGGILSLAPGGGSLDRQLFSGGDDGLWTRSQDLGAANAWAAWEKLLTSSDIKGTPNHIARFLPPGPISSKIGDSQLFDDGTDVGIGTNMPDAAYLLTVGGSTRNDGNLYVNGNVGIGKAATGFDLDVAGESNFDGRVKVGAALFPTSTDYELAVGGGIIAEEVLVQLQPWADYVFSADYQLKPLSEVESYVAKEKHLPGVASAAEVEANGLNLGQMQKVQMEKIEELYLHMIDMDKQMKALKAENDALKAKVEQLEQR